ncbi:MAG TPA: glycosyltransferase family 9 protein, partial [Bryobacteraceae bacterium]|nr:glycosyltransferase family 9 protein [Bryobacteraceae bacterium]
MYTGDKQASPGSRILVVRLGAMGDIVHTLPAVASLKHSFPGSHLTWVIEPQWYPLLEQNPFVDRVVCLRRGNPASLWESCRELWRGRYDFAVDFQGLIKSALTASLSRADRIFGFHQSQLRERAAALFYSNKTASTAAHVVDRNLDLAAAAGASSILRSFALPPGKPEGQLPDGAFVLASPLAGWQSKQWPLEYFRELGERLRKELAIPLVLNGPPAALAAFSEIADVVPNATGLSGLIHATRQAAAVVGVDSGPMHLAAALGKPGVALFGPTDPARNGPYGETFTVLRSPRAVTSYKRLANIDPSMQEISPETVFTALKAHLISS